MLCTDRFLILLACPLLLAVAAIAHPPALVGFLAADAAIAALFVADYLSARLARRHINIERDLDISLSSNTPQPLDYSIENHNRRRVQLAVRDVVPAHARLRRSIMRITVPPESRTAASNIITPRRRGPLNFGRIFLRVTGRLGLARTQWAVQRPGEIVVTPNLVAITELERTLAVGAHGPQPIRHSDLTAEGLEFERLNDYVEGDDARHIDWKATAKRHDLTVRRYEIERSQRVIIALDCGRLMASEIAGTTRLDLAVDAAVLLAHVASKRDDFVGLIAFAHDVLQFLPPKKGRHHFRAFVDAVSSLQPLRVESDYALAFSSLQRRVRRRSLVMIMTDLIDPDASQRMIQHVVQLRRRHLPLCLSIRDVELEEAAVEEPAREREVYTSVVARSIIRDAERASTVLRSHGCLVREAMPTQFSAAAVQSYLAAKKRHLL